ARPRSVPWRPTTAWRPPSSPPSASPTPNATPPRSSPCCTAWPSAASPPATPPRPAPPTPSACSCSAHFPAPEKGFWPARPQSGVTRPCGPETCLNQEPQSEPQPTFALLSACAPPPCLRSDTRNAIAPHPPTERP